MSNSSQSPVAFKVQTSSPKLFLVTPSSGVIHPGSSQTLKITINSVEEAASKAHRFLIKAKSALDANSVDWKSPDIKDYKIPAKLLQGDLDPSEDPNTEKSEEFENPNKFKPQAFKTSIVKNFLFVDNKKDPEYGRKSLGDIRYSKESEIDNNTKNIVGKYNELNAVVEQLKIDLEVVRNKQKFSIELDVLTKESLGPYSVIHVIGALFISFLIGLYLN